MPDRLARVWVSWSLCITAQQVGEYLHIGTSTARRIFRTIQALSKLGGRKRESGGAAVLPDLCTVVRAAAIPPRSAAR